MERIDMLKNMSSARVYERGDIIIREGESDTEMYIMLKGSAVVYKNYRRYNQTEIGTLKQGDFFGEMSLFLGSARSATVVALEQTVALYIDKDNSMDLFRQQPEFTFALITAICARLDEANNRTGAPTLAQQLGVEPSVTDKSVTRLDSAAAVSALFPDGHKDNYKLKLNTDKSLYFLDKEYACPACKHKFTDLSVRTTKLVSEKTDPDMRVHYKDVEPLYFEIVTCPKCLFSALQDVFNKTKRDMSEVANVLAPYQGALPLKSGVDRDVFTVFAGYHLALLCTPAAYFQWQLTTAKIWFKLSRVYADAGDEKMELYAAERSLADYRHAYENETMSDSQSSQLIIMLGELSYKTGDIINARKYFFKAKTDKTTNPVMKKRAEDRIEEMRGLGGDEG